MGGWCRSIVDNGFTFDHAGHIMFSNDPYVHEMYEKLLGDNVHWQDREAWIYSHGVYTRYPFQQALYGLPPDVLKECIVGAIEARFGPLKQPTAPPPHAGRSSPRQAAIPRRSRSPTAVQTASPRATAPLVPFEKTARHDAHGAAELRGVHLPRLGRRRREALCDSVQPQALGRAAARDGDLVARRTRAAARPRGNDRRRAAAVEEADRSERAFRLSVAWRFPGAHGWLPAVARRRAAARTRAWSRVDAHAAPGRARRRHAATSTSS